MMSEYCVIYDTDKQKYFVSSNSRTAEWSSSELVAKWFCSKLAAKMFIQTNERLQQKDNLCIEVIAKFEIQNAFEIKNALFALGKKYKRGE